MTIRKLTSQEKEDLISRHKKAKEKAISDRVNCVLKYDKGYTFEEISRFLLISRETVRGYVLDYHDKNKLKNEYKGGQSKLSTDQEAELIDHLDHNSYVCANSVSDYIDQKYGIKYTKQGTINLLHRLGFVYKKPKVIPAKIDLDKQEEFRQQYNLLKNNLKSDEAIYFMDGVHPQNQTKSDYGWIKKGVLKTIPSFSGWKRKSILGALNLDNLNVISQDYKTINEDSVIDFLSKVSFENKDKSKVYIILDNAGYNKSKKVREFIEETNMSLVFLPPYSPNLNAIERLWKFMYKKVVNNRFHKSFKEFSNKIDDFFNKIHEHKEQLKLLLNDNFERIQINHLSTPFCNNSS